MYSGVIKHQLAVWDVDEKTATTADLVVVFSRLFASREFFVAAFAVAGDRQCHVYGGAGKTVASWLTHSLNPFTFECSLAFMSVENT